MKAELMFTVYRQDMRVEFSRKTELEFVPREGMQFTFKPEPFELVVEIVMWFHDQGVLAVSFADIECESEQEFTEAVMDLIADSKWTYRADKEAARLIKPLSKSN